MLSCALNDGERGGKIYVARGRDRDIQVGGKVTEIGAAIGDWSNRGRFMNKARHSHRQG